MTGRDQLQALVLEGLLLESQLKGLSKDGQEQTLGIRFSKVPVL